MRKIKLLVGIFLNTDVVWFILHRYLSLLRGSCFVNRMHISANKYANYLVNVLFKSLFSALYSYFL